MIKVLDGMTCETVKSFDMDHNPTNVIKIAKRFGTLVNLDMSSDCLYLGTFADGTVFGFSI